MRKMPALRFAKLVASASLSLLAGGYVALNLANWREAQAAVRLVLVQDGHAVYPHNLLPVFDSPTAAILLLGVICLLEMLCAITGLIGVTGQWRARHEAGGRYSEALSLSLVSATLAMLVWLTMFTAIGGGLLQMWQSAAGQASLSGAFQFAALALLTAILLVQPDLPTD
jgi:predicted small integral membrane protein